MSEQEALEVQPSSRDNRKFPRRSAFGATVAVWHGTRDETQVFQAKVENVSRSGMLLRAEKSIPVGTDVMISLGGAAHPYPASVVRIGGFSEAAPKDHGVELGITFNDKYLIDMGQVRRVVATDKGDGATEQIQPKPASRTESNEASNAQRHHIEDDARRPVVDFAKFMTELDANAKTFASQVDVKAPTAPPADVLEPAKFGEQDAAARAIDQTSERESSVHDKVLSTEPTKLRHNGGGSSRESLTRVVELEKSRKAGQEAQERRKIQQELDIARAKLEEGEKSRIRETAERKEAQELLAKSDTQLQLEKRDKEEAQLKLAELEAAAKKVAENAAALEEDLKAKRESREEITRMLDAAQQLREGFDACRRSSMLDLDTQRARRNLVSASGVALTLSLGRMVPSEVALLGIKFEKVAPSRILMVISLVLLYLLVAFALKAWDAVQLWRAGMDDARKRVGVLNTDPRLKNMDKQVPEDVTRIKSLLDLPPAATIMTASAVSDLAMPIAVAMLAVGMCLYVH